MSSRRLSPERARDPKRPIPRDLISSDDEGAVVTREDGDRIFASSLAASTLAASHPRLGSARRSARARLTPLDDPLVEALSDALHRVVGSSAFVLALNASDGGRLALAAARAGAARVVAFEPRLELARVAEALARAAPSDVRARVEILPFPVPPAPDSCVGSKNTAVSDAAAASAFSAEFAPAPRSSWRVVATAAGTNVLDSVFPAADVLLLGADACVDPRGSILAMRRAAPALADAVANGSLACVPAAARFARRSSGATRFAPRRERRSARRSSARAARAFPRGSRTRFEPAPSSRSRTRSTCRAAA